MGVFPGVAPPGVAGLGVAGSGVVGAGAAEALGGVLAAEGSDGVPVGTVGLGWPEGGGSAGVVSKSQSPGITGWGNGAGAVSEKDGRVTGGGNSCGSLPPPGVGDNNAGAGEGGAGEGGVTGSGARASPHPTNNAALSVMTAPRNATCLGTLPIPHPLGQYGGLDHHEYMNDY